MNRPSSVFPHLDVDALLSVDAEQVPDTGEAYRRYVATHGYPATRKPFRKPVWFGAAVTCALIALLSFAPARSWGQRILNMLRVQKVAVVPVDLEAISTNGGNEKLVAQMISDRVVVTMKPGEPAQVDSPSAAASAAGFPVKTLDSLGTPSNIRVRDEAAFHIQLDRDRILALLEAAGRSDIAVPNNVDGSIIAVHIPKAVDMAYGQCSGTNREGCIHFTQVPSPVISVPPTLDIASLAESALQVAGMTAAEAHSFCQSVDWSSTLLIPIPKSGSTSRAVSIMGVNGTLVEAAANGRHPNVYALVWVKDRRIFSISGAGDSSQALAAAESLD